MLFLITFFYYANRDFGFNGLSGAQSPLDNGVVLDSLYSRDKDGASRPQGSAWDIGAYELWAGGGHHTSLRTDGIDGKLMVMCTSRLFLDIQSSR